MTDENQNNNPTIGSDYFSARFDHRSNVDIGASIRYHDQENIHNSGYHAPSSKDVDAWKDESKTNNVLVGGAEEQPQQQQQGEGGDDDDGKDNQHSHHVSLSMDIEKTAKMTMVVALLVLVVGAVATASFLYMGITGAQHDKSNKFVAESSDMVKEVSGALSDYELAGLSIHESCRQWRQDNFTRANFKALFDYIDEGLDFYAMEWVPNVTHDERPALESQFYNEFGFPNSSETQEVYYNGFVGVVNGSMDQLLPRPPQSYYFPIQFFEPMSRVGQLMHYDIWSAPWEAPTIASALEKWSPVVTSGFKIVGSGEQDTFTVVLYHPGLPLPDRKPRDVSNILIQIKALLERAVRTETERPHSRRNDLFYEEIVSFASRQWTIVVIPVDDSYTPNIIPIVISGALIFIASLALTYWMIHNMKRSLEMHRIVTKASAEASIVASLFPAKVRERMIKEAAAKEAEQQKSNSNKKNSATTTTMNNPRRNQDVFLNSTLDPNRLKSFMTSEGIFGSKPIADLHENTTIMFADLAGFTSWSASREPTQVFMLLEVLYHSFDTIAHRKGVFKVETIGDCYVAVAGLPEPRDDHAAVMCHFASSCLRRMHQLCKALSSTLGRETEDLAFRVGLHSGSVTAGVLRGEKGRFQLFGDTMNMASRMESTGVRNKIQVSEATAKILSDTGHEKWLTPREDLVEAKGKGTVKTYFVKISEESRLSTDTQSDFGDMEFDQD